MKLPLAREGMPFVLICVVLLVPALVWARSGSWGLRAIVPAALAVLTLFVVYFFRDPERTPPGGEGLVISPADGKVIDMQTVPDEAFMGGEATRITIFLSIFNVHVQRAPLSGSVGHYAYHPGGFAVAWHEKASSENERASLGIETPAGRVLVRQIAGLVARRIVTYPREGDQVKRGQRIGLIRFGSRVDVFLPPHWETTVNVGDVVKGGLSPMARLPGSVRYGGPS